MSIFYCFFLSLGPEMLSAIIEQHVNLAANQSENGKLSKVPKLLFFLFVLIVGKRKQSDSTKKELMFLSFYMTGGREGRMKVGHQVEDFIKSCTFGGLECEIDDG